MTKRGMPRISRKESIIVRRASSLGALGRILLILIMGSCAIISSRVFAQTFADVQPDYWAFPLIEALSAAGITVGCGGGDYCPADSVTRAQMAVFLVRGKHGSDFGPPAATGNVFADVAANDFAASFIEHLFLDGITVGCGNNNFCPNDIVTRDQMAVFLLRAIHGQEFAPPAPVGIFADVPLTHWAVAWIEQFAAEGITAGCGGGNYCPDGAVARDQMAVFLVRSFQISRDTNIIVSGLASDMPLTNALISGTVLHSNTSTDEFTTTTDGLGRYVLDMDTIARSDFISLRVDGVGSQQGAALISLVSSTGALRDIAGSGATGVSSDEYGALDITHVTTALAVLAERANGGPITTDSELTMAQSQVNGADLLTMAAVIKAVIDNPGVNLPVDITDTLDLVRDAVEFDAFLAELEINFPAELSAAFSGTADMLELGYPSEDVPGVLYATYRDKLPLTGQTFVFEFSADNTGLVTLFNGSSGLTWEVNTSGEIEVTLLNPPLTESFQFRDPPGGQVRASTFVDQLRMVRLAEGIASDQVIILSRTVTTFPDNPGLPDEIVQDVPNPENIFLAFRREDIVPFLASKFDGMQFATYYYHQNNNSIGLSETARGADLLQFNTDGTGATSRRDFFFQWTIDSAGALVVSFLNGDATAYVRYSTDGNVVQMVAVGALTNGATGTSNAELIEFDGVSDFSAPMLLDRRYRAMFALFDPDFSIFDYLFQSAGSGCRISVSPPGQTIQWQATAENYMDSNRFGSFAPSVPLDRRSWQAIAVIPGILGDRHWLIENAEFNSTNDPNFVFTDPTVTPGRINAYEFVDDLTGQFDPCGLGAVGSLTTLFNSNNGATGNMIDVVTNNSQIEVTGLDVNVAMVAGVQFGLSIYTASGGFQDTITAAPGCTFNCDFDILAWTLTASGTATSQGQDSASFVDLSDFVLNANSTTGIWITLERDGSIVDEFRYTNGSSMYSNSDITISNSAGVTGPTASDPAEGVAFDRQWNGTIYYNTQ